MKISSTYRYTKYSQIVEARSPGQPGLSQQLRERLLEPLPFLAERGSSHVAKTERDTKPALPVLLLKRDRWLHIR
jgi:hypothetical protein